MVGYQDHVKDDSDCAEGDRKVILVILVTGGAGYIGAHANKTLSQRGYETLVLDNLIYGHREFAHWGEFIQGDLGDIERLRKLFKEYPIEAVMHFAAYAYVGESVEDPQKYYLNNMRNTLNLLQAMLEHDVKYFVFSSSCAVYGMPETLPIPEDHSLAPINPYGKTKWMIEEILRDYSNSYGLKYVSLRYFNAAGADPEGEIGEWHEPETHLIPLVLQTALGKRDHIEIYGTDYDTPDGTCIRDYIHVTDLADAHLLALEDLYSNGESDIFNLGNGTGYSVKEVIEMAREVTGREIPSKETPRRPGDPPRLIAASQKARAVLGWQPQFEDLSDIIETAWRWELDKYNFDCS